MNLSKFNKKSRGFTLIEILLVIAILSILLVVVFAALNPATRLQDTRNSRRWNDVNQYLTAIHEYIVDNDGSLPSGLTDDGTTYEIVDGAVASGCSAVCTGVVDTNCADLSSLVTNNYLGSLPEDPTAPAAGHTSYSVTVDSGVVTIAACGAEGGESISVSR